MKYVIALDAGTTSVRAYLYDAEAGVFVHGAQQEVGQSAAFIFSPSMRATNRPSSAHCTQNLKKSN